MTLGGGTRMFADGSVRLRPVAADTEPLVTHLTYAVD